MATAEVRPMRMCDVCGGVDDHPRHVFALGPNEDKTKPEIGLKALENCPDDETKSVIMLQIVDDLTIMRHMDCCREAGCPDGVCNQTTEGAEELRGMDLVEHLTREV